ncbi:MAG: hypothetical protein JSV57_05095 [Candidatus Bathyarchaeota archaeon]|nr:MAG: hypothetical protein JSV57_05095 [Candidatus Bathyarchaeota archaeon]
MKRGDRRTKYDIYADLLKTVMKRGSCGVTRASYGANLPIDRAKKFLKFLAFRGFAREETVDGSPRYRITKRGIEYLEVFRRMRKMFAALSEEL